MKELLVIEAADGIAGPVCGLQFADLGARVVKVEPPAGDRSRHWGTPARCGESAPFLALNRNKESLSIDATGAGGRDVLTRLLERADVLIEHARPDAPAWTDLLGREPVEVNGALVHMRICANGTQGPLAGRAGSELTAQALSGYSRMLGRLGEAPLRHGAEVAEIGCGMFAYQAALAALLYRNRSGRGQAIDLSLLGALMTYSTILTAALHNPDQWTGFHLMNILWPPDTGFHTADHKVTLEFRRGTQVWADFCKRVGLGHLIGDPRFADWRSTVYTGDRVGETKADYEAVLARLPSEAVIDAVTLAGGTSVRHNTAAAIACHPQLACVGAFAEVPMVDGGSMRQVATPFTTADGAAAHRPPPRLGEHTAAILAELAQAGAGPAQAPPPAAVAAHGPLHGVRVLDISQAAVGPWAGTLLGQLGAEIIKVEPPGGDLIHYVMPNQNGVGTTYATMNLNKRGIILDLKQAADRAAALELAANADVVLENFRPGVVERLGIDYATVRKSNPRVVYCSATGFGTSGPMKDTSCTDQHAQAFCGYGALNGEPGSDGQLMRYYAHHDLTTALLIVQAVLTALWTRDKTGVGARVETTMIQAGMALQRVRLAEFFASGVEPPRLGSGISYCVPDQAFLCGDRKYLAVTAGCDSEWVRLCGALGVPQLADDARFRSNALRIAHRALLVALLGERFKAKPAPWWELALARAGVPAALFVDNQEQRHHAHFAQAGMITKLSKEPWGELAVGGLPWHFRATPTRVEAPPFPGEHTKEVLSERGLAVAERPVWRLAPRDVPAAAATLRGPRHAEG